MTMVARARMTVRLWMPLVVCTLLGACGSNATPGEANPGDGGFVEERASTSDDAGPDVASAPCGAAGEPCCTGAACNAGLTCQNGSCACVGVDLQTDPKNCGACGHDCLGGGCTKGACEPIILAQGQNVPTWLALDGVNAYWINSAYLSTPPASVALCSIHGCNQKPTVLASPIAGGIHDIATDGTDTFWTVTATGDVFSCAVSGCANSPTSLGWGGSPSVGELHGIALDAASIYISSRLAVNASTNGGALSRCPKTACGGAPATLVSMTFPSTQLWAGGIALHDGIAYFSTVDHIASCNAAGCNNAPTVLAAGAAGADSIAVNATDVYWADAHAVHRCPIPGCAGGPRVVVEGLNDILAISIDAKNVFIADNGAGQVLSCPLDGCGLPTLVAGGQSAVSAIANDAAAVYWVTPGLGTVVKLAK